MAKRNKSKKKSNKNRSRPKNAQSMTQAVLQKTKEVVQQKTNDAIKDAADTADKAVRAEANKVLGNANSSSSDQKASSSDSSDSTDDGSKTSSSDSSDSPAKTEDKKQVEEKDKKKPYFSNLSIVIIILFIIGCILLIIPTIMHHIVNDKPSLDLANMIMSCIGAVILAINNTILIFKKDLRKDLRISIIILSSIFVITFLIYAAYYNSKVHNKAILIATSFSFLTYVYILLLSNKKFSKKELGLYTGALFVLVITLGSVILATPQITGHDKKLQTVMIIVVSCISSILFIGIVIKIFLSFKNSSAVKLLEKDPELLLV